MTTIARRALLATPALALTLTPTSTPTLTPSALAQSGGLQLIVPYPPGGGNDVGARALAPMLERELGMSVVVLNRAGAASQIGMTQVARAAPDGRTIGYGLWPQTTTLYLDPARQAQFTRASFTPLALHATDPGAIVVRADSPWHSVTELVAASRARPDDFRMSDNGRLGHEHMASIRLQQLAGLRFNQVHFQGAGPAIVALLGGQTEAAIFAVGTVRAQVEQGAMRALSVLSENTSAFLPGVPTAQSLGFDIVAGSARGFVAPAGLPAEVARGLATALARAITAPDHVDRMRQLAIPITFRDAAGFGRYWEAEERALAPLLAALPAEG